MGLFNSLRISASALMAQRMRMDVVANNVANVNTTRGVDGLPYRRQSVTFRRRIPSTVSPMTINRRSTPS